MTFPVPCLPRPLRPRSGAGSGRFTPCRQVRPAMAMRRQPERGSVPTALDRRTQSPDPNVTRSTMSSVSCGASLSCMGVGFFDTSGGVEAPVGEQFS